MLCHMRSIEQYCGVDRKQDVLAYMYVSVYGSVEVADHLRHSTKRRLGYASDVPHGRLYLSRNGLISTL